MQPASPPLPPLASPGYVLAQAELAACSKVVGEAFFPVMVEALANALMVRWVLLCSLHPSDPTKVRTIAVWDNGPGEQFEYSLEHTPCSNIVTDGTCIYREGVARLFPRDEMLVKMGAESYVGAPLRSTSGEVLGLLAVLSDKPMNPAHPASDIVEVFAGRAAAELERIARASINERLGQIVENSVSEAYVFDADTYKFVLVNRGARANLGYTIEELRQLTPWDIKPEFTTENFVRMAEQLRKGGKSHFFFETVHRRKDSSVYDVAVQLQYIPGAEDVYYASITDISDRKHAEQTRAHLAAIVSSARDAIISKDLHGTIKSWNGGAEQMFGYSAAEMVGTPIRHIIPPDRQGEEDEILAKISQGEKISNFDTIRVRRDGQNIDVSITISPIVDGGGNIIGASKIAHDISERKRAEERERLLMREINHRAKNLLTLVNAIARQTSAGDLETFRRRFGDRIRALAASQDVLVHDGWQDVAIEALVRSQLAHFGETMGDRIRVSGPDLKIKAASAQAVGLALHELATNAAKFGALSNETGTVAITWKIVGDEEPEQRFSMMWMESGGPPVTKPTRKGFGSTVIDHVLRANVNGDIDIDFAPGGLVWRLTCPTSTLLQAIDAPAGRVETSPGWAV